MTRLRLLADRYERAVYVAVRSLWSTVGLVFFGLAWIVAEAMRGKWIGWDGFLTLVALEAALAVARALPKRPE